MSLTSTGIALAVAGLALGQNATDVRQLYDAGRYQEVVRATEQATGDDDSASRVRYLAAQSYARLKDADGARRLYQHLADNGANAWAPIGQSALQAADGQLDAALASANRAVSVGGSLAEAHYQRGLVLMTRMDYGAAGEAFARAIELDPALAAAYYYAGLAGYRVKRIDVMSNNFSTFVKLAPNAPERPEVESILRTVRGR